MINPFILIVSIAFAVVHFVIFPDPIAIENDTRKLVIMFGCTLFMLIYVFLYAAHIVGYWEMVLNGAIVWAECLARPLLIVMRSAQRVSA